MGKFSHVRSSNRKAGVRTPRLEHLLREELNFLFQSEVSDPQLADLQVERVHLSPNSSLATVYVFHCPNTTEAGPPLASGATVTDLSTPVQKALLRATAFLRSRLSDALPLKRSPELRFEPGLPGASVLYRIEEDTL